MRAGIAALATLWLASCVSPPPIRLAIVNIEIRYDDARGIPLVSAMVAEDQLNDRLVASGRFQIVERRYMDRLAKEALERENPGKLAAADWILYGTLEESARGPFDPNKRPLMTEVAVHARIVRVEDGVIIYSKRHKGTTEGWSPLDGMTDDATRKAIDKLADDILELAGR
jgi:hypothetical protein